MIKNKLIALGAVALVSASTAGAQSELSVTTSFTYETAYMFRGVKLAENTYFPSIDVSYDAFYAGVWAALPVDTRTDNEVDFYAGYGLQLSELMSLDLGATYYTYPSSTDKFFDGDVNTLEFYAGLAFEVPYSPAFYVYYDIDVEAFTFELSAGHSIEIAENLTFDVSAAGGWVVLDDDLDSADLTDLDTYDNYGYFVATVGFGYAVTEATSISIYASHSIATEDYGFMRGGRYEVSDNETWFGFSVTAGF